MSKAHPPRSLGLENLYVPGQAQGPWVGCRGGLEVNGQLTVSPSGQVLYKLAWSESVERDCATFCAKK